jgi:hypothetical protein
MMPQDTGCPSTPFYMMLGIKPRAIVHARQLPHFYKWEAEVVTSCDLLTA